MNTIDEQTQMMLFDLLEGNLNEEEAQKLLGKIESDTLLNNEFRLLKATYLKPDTEIIFEDKNSLYKSARVVPIYRRMSFRYAAAIAILLLGVGAFWQFSENNISDVVAQTGQTTPLKTPPGQQSNIQKNSTPDYQSVLPTSRVANKSANKTQTDIEQNVYTSEQQLFFTRKDTASLPIVAELEQVPNRRTMPSLVNDTSFLQDYEFVFDYNSKPEPITKRRSLGYRLLNSSRYMLANLSLPDIELQKKGNKLKIEVFTYDKNTIANLEY